MILDETRERFLTAIAKQVDPTRIAEIHFFAPIRQGGVESGVAVIAAARADAVPSPSTIDATVDVPAEAAASTEPASDTTPDEAPAVEPEHEVVAAQEVVAEHEAVAEQEEESPYADDEVVAASTAEDITPAEQTTESADDPDPVEPPPAPIERHVIYTARYRLTLKGPDRGKWETNVTAEADAPIITVDAVVRGVQRRAGDTDDPTRMNGEEVRAALPKAR